MKHFILLLLSSFISLSLYSLENEEDFNMTDLQKCYDKCYVDESIRKALLSNPGKANSLQDANYANLQYCKSKCPNYLQLINSIQQKLEVAKKEKK